MAPATTTSTAAPPRVPAGMRAVLGLHENVVTGAADGYARMANRPAATLLHLGVGLSNGPCFMAPALVGAASVVCCAWRDHRAAEAARDVTTMPIHASATQCTLTPSLCLTARVLPPPP